MNNNDAHILARLPVITLANVINDTLTSSLGFEMGLLLKGTQDFYCSLCFIVLNYRQGTIRIT